VQPDPSHAGDEEAFWVEVEQAGLIAPGLAQAFTVTFTPVRGVKYYYAEVSVRGSAGGTLMVPLHAYPVASGFTLPRELDLGRVPLGRSATRTLELRTSVPIPFSVALAPIVPHPDISVAPLELVVPPNGTASLTVTYRPSQHATAVAEFSAVTSSHAPGLGGDEEDLSAYGVPASRGAAFYRAVPVTLRVSGSSAPSMERDARVFAALEHSRGIAALEAAPGAAAAATAAALAETGRWAERTRGGDRSAGAEAKKEGEGEGGGEEERQGEGAAAAAPPSEQQQQQQQQQQPFFSPLPAPVGASTRSSRWLKKDPGLAAADETLASFKRRQEGVLVEALRDRDALVGVLASEMHRATGAPVDIEGARKLVAERLGGPTAPVDAYKQPGGGYAGDGTRVDADVAAKHRPVDVLRGVRVPGGLSTQADVDAVLFAKPGYIPPSQLGDAIQEKRDLAAAAAAAQTRIAAATRGALGGGGGEEGGGAARGGASPPRAPLSFTATPAAFAGAGPVSPRTAARLGGFTSARDARAQALLRGVPEAEAAAALRRAYAAAKAEKLGVGPALPPPALAAAVVGESFLFPVLQASPLEGLRDLIRLLGRTPDAAPLDSGGLLDEALGVCGGTLLSGAERAAALAAAAQPRGTDLLTPVLAALVRAAAAPLLAPARLKEAVFLAEHAALDAAEGGREMSSAPWRGEPLLHAAHAAGVVHLRAQLRALEDAVARRLARTRRASLAVPPVGHLPAEARRRALAGSEVRPLGVPPPPPGAEPRYAPLSAGALFETPLLRSAALPAGAPLVRAGARAPAPVSFRDATGRDAWVGRRAAVDRFRASVAAAVAEERALARVGELRSLLGGVAAGIAAAGEGGVHHEDVVTLTRVINTSLEGAGGGGGEGADLNRSLATLEAVADIAPTMVAVRAAATDAVANGVRAVKGGDRWVEVGGGARRGAGGTARLDPAAWRIPVRRGAGFWAPAHDDTSNVGACAVAAVAPPPPRALARASAAALAAAAEHRVGGWDLRLPIPGLRAPSWAPTAARLPENGWRFDGEAGHTPLPVPVAPLHAAPEPARPLRQGALHEGGASGVLPLASGQPALDSGLSDALGACLAAGDVASPAVGRLGAGGARHWELGEGLAQLRGEAPPEGGGARPLAGALVGVPGVGGWDQRTGAEPGPPLEGSAAAALGPGLALAQPFAAALPDAPSKVRGVAPPHAYAAGAVAAAPGRARAPTARWPLRAPSPLRDLNGALATVGAQTACAPGLSSLRALEMPPPPGASGANDSPWLLFAAPPARSRPPFDALAPLLVEDPPPPVVFDGRVRLPTDVTPPAERVYVVPPPPPPARVGVDVLSPGGAGASALWAPAGLPPLMDAPAEEDALSDDSESDPDDSEREGEGGKRGGAGAGSPSPRSKRPPPTLAQARAQLLPAAAAAGAAPPAAGAAARGAQAWVPREAALDQRAAAGAAGAMDAVKWLPNKLQPLLAPHT
jgi:hypothetical protein